MNILKTLVGAVETGAGIMTGQPQLAAMGAASMLQGITQPNASSDIVAQTQADTNDTSRLVNGLGTIAAKILEPDNAAAAAPAP